MIVARLKPGYSKHIQIREGGKEEVVKEGGTIEVESMNDLGGAKHKFEIMSPGEAYQAPTRLYLSTAEPGRFHLHKIKDGSKITDGTGISYEDVQESFPAELAAWTKSKEHQGAHTEDQTKVAGQTPPGRTGGPQKVFTKETVLGQTGHVDTGGADPDAGAKSVEVDKATKKPANP